MIKKLSFHDKYTFFRYALKQHLFTYLLSLFFLVSFGGVGLAILLFSKSSNFTDTFGALVFLIAGIGVFSLMFYLNISSMQYYYELAIIKKYARYKTATITEISKEIAEDDGVIRCFISVNYEGYILTDLFELSIEKENLLKYLKEKMYISIRIAEQLPSAMRISPRKLLRQLEELNNV